MKECVIDATMGYRDGLFTFIPVIGMDTDEPTFVTGMMHLSGDTPNGMKMVGIIHEDGQQAVEAFCKEHQKEIDALIAIRDQESK